jgi:biotin carboxyl carrier protein
MIHLDADVNGRIYKLAFESEGGKSRVLVDGREHIVDARCFDGFFYSLLIDNRSYEVTVEENGEGFRVQVGTEALQVQRLDPLRRARQGSGPARASQTRVRSVMPGKVVRVLVEEGEQVSEGQPLIVLEAMKMENEVLAPFAGTVVRVPVGPGAAVEGGAELLVLE